MTALSFSWIEARGVVKHPTKHRTAPHNKELSGSFNNAEVQKPWSRKYSLRSKNGGLWFNPMEYTCLPRTLKEEAGFYGKNTDSQDWETNQ